MRSRILLRLGKYREVRRLLRPVLRRGNYHPNVLITYGCSLAREGNFNEALGYFTKVTKRYPEHLQARILQGEALIDLGRPQEALAGLEKAWQIAPDDDHVQFLYCKTLFALGQYQRSLAELPVGVVAHSIFHEFLELANRGHKKEEIESTLLRFHSVFAKSPGPEALAGGLTEFTSHMYQQAEADEAPLLRRWFEAISRLFSADAHFEILIKMFDVLVRYKESHDEKVLLELPLEQRRLLEPPVPGPEKTPTSEPATSRKRSTDLSF